MELHTLVLGAYQTNCYLVSGAAGRCVIIDPGYEADAILEKLKALQLTAETILLTHGHFDHVGEVRTLAAELDIPVYLHEKELSLPPVMTAGELYYTHTYAEGDVLALAGLQIRVMETPGHTPGSVCLVTGEHMFSGDTLFQGSCGRVDFPGSSPADMRRSLARLAALETDFTVHPGHGEETTLFAEKRWNPYMPKI